MRGERVALGDRVARAHGVNGGRPLPHDDVGAARPDRGDHSRDAVVCLELNSRRIKMGWCHLRVLAKSGDRWTTYVLLKNANVPPCNRRMASL